MASRVVGIWVSSTSFIKSKIGWPQQPPIKKGGKFQYDISWIYQITMFSKHPNKAEFKNLKDSKVFNSHFQTLEPLQLKWPLMSNPPPKASMTFTVSFHQKHFWFFHWYLHYFCWRLLRPVNVTFLKTDSWNSNIQPSWSR